MGGRSISYAGGAKLREASTVEPIMLASLVIAADIAAIAFFLAGARRVGRPYARRRA